MAQEYLIAVMGMDAFRMGFAYSPPIRAGHSPQVNRVPASFVSGDVEGILHLVKAQLALPCGNVGVRSQSPHLQHFSRFTQVCLERILVPVEIKRDAPRFRLTSDPGVHFPDGWI